MIVIHNISLICFTFILVVILPFQFQLEKHRTTNVCDHNTLASQTETDNLPWQMQYCALRTREGGSTSTLPAAYLRSRIASRGKNGKQNRNKVFEN